MLQVRESGRDEIRSFDIRFARITTTITATATVSIQSTTARRGSDISARCAVEETSQTEVTRVEGNRRQSVFHSGETAVYRASTFRINNQFGG